MVVCHVSPHLQGKILQGVDSSVSCKYIVLLSWRDWLPGAEETACIMGSKTMMFGGATMA